MTKVTIDSYRDHATGISEVFTEKQGEPNIINQSWDDEGSYLYGDVIWSDKTWKRGSIWYEGDFFYKSDGYLNRNSVIKKGTSIFDDGSSSTWISDLNVNFFDISNASNSAEQWEDFLKTRYSGNDTIKSYGGGSITANTYNGDDEITVDSGNNNNVNGGAGNDKITIGAKASGSFFGDVGDDVLTNNSSTASANGGRGNDSLKGNSLNNELRGGNGRDILTGGGGGDILYGGFGFNTFTGERGDGYSDEIYIKSDHLAYNFIYNKANNNPNGSKADKIGALDTFDRIFIQGAETSQLSFGYVEHISSSKEMITGIGIYADGSLEAIYESEGGLSVSDIQSMTSGVTI